MSSRLKQFVIVMTLGLILLLSASVFAQDGAGRALAPGVAVSSALSILPMWHKCIHWLALPVRA